MTLQNDRQLENTRRKLAELQSLIERKEQSAAATSAHEWALDGLKRWERKLQAEIQEYESVHQRA